MRKVLAIDGRGAISVIEEPVPQPGPNEIVIETRVSMISPGTEMGGVVGRRKNPSDAPPGGFGYQNAGDVISVGEGVERFRPGDRVACMGIRDPAHATHTLIPVNMALPLPEGVSYEEGASAHLGATALHAVRRAELQLSEFVVVVGMGLVGQFCAQFARMAGCRVMAVDRLPLRLDIARACGAHRTLNPREEDALAAAREFTRGYGVDCAFLAFGGDGTEAFKQVLAMMKVTPDTHQMGRIVIPGGCSVTHAFGAALGNVDIRSAARTGPGFLDPEYEHGADYPPVFVRWTTQRNLEEVLLTAAAGELRIAPFITHRFPIEQGPEACELLIEHPGDAVGVVLTME